MFASKLIVSGRSGNLVNHERQMSIKEYLGREAEAVAPQKVDLETAVMAVMARACFPITAATGCAT
jgi:hypothetical protein